MHVSSHCLQCGSELETDSDFCTSCGIRIVRPSPVTTQEPVSHRWMGEEPSGFPQAGPIVQTPSGSSSVPYVQPVAQSSSTESNGAPTILGIIAVSVMAVGLIPCLGALNYLNIVFSFITIIICIVSLASARTDRARTSAVIGLVLSLLAAFVGVVRLILGGGCL